MLKAYNPTTHTNMQTHILDGKQLAETFQHALAENIQALIKQGIKSPHLVVILIGDHPASQVYVQHKIRACEKIGMRSTLRHLPADTSQADLLACIHAYNQDRDTHGILVQLPLPLGFDMTQVLAVIDHRKDVDGFHTHNAGALAQAQNASTHLQPCTPLGCMELLKAYNIPISGQHAVVVGASNIVGKPMAAMLLQAGATVTICNSKTPDIAVHTSMADIVVIAVGKPHMLKKAHIKAGAVVIDVGINRLDNGRLCGDVDADDLQNHAAYVSPVPGGVGPMTIAMLLHNTYKAMQMQVQTQTTA